MHIVGTDEMTVREGRSVPAGHRHAVDPTGRVLCRSARARFTWPAMGWSDTDEDTCPLCTQVRRAQQMFATPVEATHGYPAVAVYPAAPVYPALPPLPALPSVPAQPTQSALSADPTGAADDDAVYAEPTDSVA